MGKLPGQTIILMRHAKSDWGSGHQSDVERTLNLRGRRDAQMMADWLKPRLKGPVKLLCSPAQRTRETSLEIVRAIPHAALVIEDSLYLASLTELIQAVRSHADACLLVVGHNPGLEELLRYIDPEAEGRCTQPKIFPTCALYAYQISGVFAQPGWACSYLYHQRPKQLAQNS